MRKVIAAGILVAASAGVGGGAYIFDKGLEANHKSDHLASTIDTYPLNEQIDVSSKAEKNAEHGLEDILTGTIIVGVGAGTLFLAGVELKNSTTQS